MQHESHEPLLTSLSFICNWLKRGLHLCRDLAADLAQITFDFPFKIPPYFALIIRAISVLEGIALLGNPGASRSSPVQAHACWPTQNVCSSVFWSVLAYISSLWMHTSPWMLDEPFGTPLLSRMQLVRSWSRCLSVKESALLWCVETRRSFCAPCMCSAMSAIFA